jgi:hypothetical protein
MTTAGWWPPPSCPQRPVVGSKRTAGTLGHWPAWLAQETSRRSMSPRWKMQPCVLAHEPVTIPSAIARTPRFASKPSCSDTISLYGPGALEPGPSQVALRGDLSPTGSTNRLARIRPSGARTYRTPPASRTGTARSRASVVFAPSD